MATRLNDLPSDINVDLGAPLDYELHTVQLGDLNVYQYLLGMVSRYHEEAAHDVLNKAMCRYLGSKTWQEQHSLNARMIDNLCRVLEMMMTEDAERIGKAEEDLFEELGIGAPYTHDQHRAFCNAVYVAKTRITDIGTSLGLWRNQDQSHP